MIDTIPDILMAMMLPIIAIACVAGVISFVLGLLGLLLGGLNNLNKQNTPESQATAKKHHNYGFYADEPPEFTVNTDILENHGH